MKLAVCGIDDLGDYECSDFTHMISIADSGFDLVNVRLPGITADRHLILRFSDVDDAKHEDAPTAEKIHELFSWLEQHSELNSLLVHCRAGKCRSPAVALLALCFLAPSVEPEEHLFSIRDVAGSSLIVPNVLITALGDAILQRNGQIVSAVNRWRAEQESVYVTGQIARPGAHLYTKQLTLRRAIARARGFGDFANPRKVKILRKGSDPMVYDVTAIDAGELEDPELHADDTIVVPRKVL